MYPLQDKINKPSSDYDNIRNLSTKMMKKGDRDDLLSQYFNAKKSMKI